MITAAVRELPPRTYPADAPIRRRWLPFGMSHPAKCNLGLVADLFRRYTLPGQTVLDPFGGIGSSLYGCAEGRNVVLLELEAKFAAEARRNAAHLRANAMPGMVAGWARVLQADSRRIPMRTADACIGSPPYADVAHDPGNLDAMRAKMEQLYPGHVGPNSLRNATGYGHADGQIGNLARGSVDAALTSPPYADAVSQHPSANDLARRLERMEAAGIDTSKKSNLGGPNGIHHQPQSYSVDVAMASPPYGDLAKRDRSKQPYAASDPERAARYGQDAPNRNVDGYGDHTPGQIGDLRHDAGDSGVVTSPPYADTAVADARHLHFDDRRRDFSLAEKQQHGVPTGYGQMAGNLGNADPETYASACLAVYRECYRIVRLGGVLVLVTGNYVRSGQVIDLAADTIRLAEAAGWTTVERWRHDKAVVSFWRRLHHQQHRPVVTHEDVLVFVKGHQGWPFTDLPLTTMAAAVLSAAKPAPIPQPMLLEFSA